MDISHDQLRRRGREHAGPEARIAAVEVDLAAEFREVASPTTVADVVLGARRDLDRDVPLESLDEFLHRLARQRLLDVCGARRPQLRAKGHR